MDDRILPRRKRRPSRPVHGRAVVMLSRFQQIWAAMMEKLNVVGIKCRGQFVIVRRGFLTTGFGNDWRFKTSHCYVRSTEYWPPEGTWRHSGCQLNRASDQSSGVFRVLDSELFWRRVHNYHQMTTDHSTVGTRRFLKKGGSRGSVITLSAI